MKNTIVLYFFAFLFLFASCEENKPLIPPLGGQATGERKVLIEEFTGVRCVNCPQGSEEIENLRTIYGENLITVGIHSGSFSSPYPESTIDFRTDAGDALIDFLGVPLGYPSAVINRTLPEGKTRLQTSQSTWAGLVQQELDKPNRLNISIDKNFNTTDNQLFINISLLPLENINEELRLSVMLAENNIVNTQLTPEGKNDDYVHRHNLRAMITNFTGDQITEALNTGVVVERTFTFTIPDSWQTEEVSIIAFVHQSGDIKEVLQVEEVKI